MQQHDERSKAEADDVRNRAQRLVFEAPQGNAERHGDHDYREHGALIAERTEEALGHVFEKLADGIELGRHFGRFDLFFHLAPFAGPDKIGDKQADQDRHQRVEQQQAEEPPAAAAGKAGVHQGLHHCQQDQRRGQRPQESQHQPAGNRQGLGPDQRMQSLDEDNMVEVAPQHAV